MRYVNEYNENTILNLAREAMTGRMKRQHYRAYRIMLAQQRLKELEDENKKLLEMVGGSEVWPTV